MRPIGILGGTFDPVHIGHLRPALELQESLGLAEVRLVPCRIPPHREMPQADAAARLELLRAAVAETPGLSVDTRELEREGPSYMVDTLTSLRSELGATPLCLILGMDAFLGLPGWHRWQELIGLAHLVVMERPGSEPPADGELGVLLATHRTYDAAALAAAPAGAVLFVGVTQLDVSATRLRELCRARRSIRYLTPPAVELRIADLGLYRD